MRLPWRTARRYLKFRSAAFQSNDSHKGFAFVLGVDRERRARQPLFALKIYNRLPPTITFFVAPRSIRQSLVEQTVGGSGPRSQERIDSHENFNENHDAYGCCIRPSRRRRDPVASGSDHADARGHGQGKCP